ncbi:pullulanase-type alpha-1,6-glucosidase [Propioniciclava sinopodophylli]|uniref:pullulanase-type alpha-1,6-glucosidase n=1 Tax=Propioniciclava sinopodophylli TaxID=1837344 RepID=UPI002492E890|nr:pullulanase-type alpha-1,6-glucosidase [Propioniciclava sinopodophylli]
MRTPSTPIAGRLLSLVVSLALALTGAIGLGAVVAPTASAATTSVTLVGTLQTELGCAGDWDAACTATNLADDDGDGVWTADFTVPTGEWEFKIALNGTWDVSYGNGTDNYPLRLAAATTLTFLFDDETKKISLAAPDLPGDYDATTDAGLVAPPVRELGEGESFYFVLTDRFDNGSTANDTGGLAGDRTVTGFDPTDKGFYHGGDIAGLARQLDYIEGLGTTAIWLTPSFKNNYVQGEGADASAGYHGYWVTDFTQIDPHLGTNAELEAFIDAAHARGIKVYFDIITNHTADLIDYAEGQYSYVDIADKPYKDVNGNTVDVSALAGQAGFPDFFPDTRSFPYTPVRSPENTVMVPDVLNDVTLYHNRGDSTWSGESVTFGDFVGLDDLMTEDPVVVDTMIAIYKAWVDLGIDGYRIDTAKHVNFEFWEAFTAAVNEHAVASDNPDFFMFGEVYDADPRLLSPYVRDTDMTSVLDFAFQAAAVPYARGLSADRLARLFAGDDYYTTDHSSSSALPTFLGNHDMGRVGRLLQGAGSELERSRLAHALMYLTRGQPVVYYGDEQGFVGDGSDKDAREDMMASQTDSYLDNVLLDGTSYGTGSHFDTDAPLYQHIAALSALRDAHPALDTGAQIELHAADGAGVYAFARVDRTEKVEYVVALNNTTGAAEASFATLTPGATYAPLFGSNTGVDAGADGTVSLTVPALSAVVLKADRPVADAAAAQAISVTSGPVDANGLLPVSADIADDRWAETSFAWRIVGSDAYAPLGTAEDDTPRVFADVRDLPAGTAVELRAISVDADGSAVAASTLHVVGTDLTDPVVEPGPDPGPGPSQGRTDLIVSIPGSLNSELGCPGDWQPECTEIRLEHRGNGVYAGTFDVPAGTWEYKIAIGGSWDENYGAGGVPNGGNASFTLATPESVTFVYDDATKWFTSSAQGPLITLPGSFQSEVGCPGDWQPDCLVASLQDMDGDGIYTWTSAAIPAGSYEVKVAHNLSWAENYGVGGALDGDNYAFTAPGGKPITLTYDIETHLLTIDVTGPPLDGVGQFLGHWIDAATIAWPANLAPDPAGTTWQLWGDADGGLALTDGEVTGGAGEPAVLLGTLTHDPAGLSADQLENRGHLAGFLALKLSLEDGVSAGEALQGQLAVLQTGADGVPTVFTGLQIPGVLDDLYAGSARGAELGVTFAGGVPTLRVWAPTARSVALELFPGLDVTATPEVVAMTRGADGTWSVTGDAAWENRAYRYVVDVYAPSTGGRVTNHVTDPYSVGLTLNSTASVVLDLDDPAWAPALWADTPAPVIDQFVDRTIYELHIRDFSISDETVPEELRGTYAAFALEGTDGVRRLGELAEAGMNTVHLLPSFDIATIEEDRAAQQEPDIPADAAPDSEAQQAAVMAVADADGFNWGYDPYHYSTPEGSYASAGNQVGGDRTAEFRTMVGGLHRTGYQVVLDKVYNHTAQSGQGDKSVLDKVVPGYYHRLNLTGAVETSTCCQNVATEHEMAEKLMVDSVVTWARDYRVDGFRFDLMGHHSVDNMLAVRAALDELTLAGDGVDGKNVYLYGEGWNFGEVADNARFTQATQGQLDGTHIGAFNDRLRDAVHGGGPFDENKAEFQGFGTGLYTDPNGVSTRTPEDQLADLRHDQDLIRLGMAGNLEDYAFETAAGVVQTGNQLDYNGSPAGYATEPDESVNYVDAHDNETLYDLGVWKLPVDTSMDDRVRMNTVSLGTVALGQSPAFWHAGTDLLRSKSLDRNSYNSGDWFNQLDWSMQTNNFGVGLPPEPDNGAKWDAMRPLLADPALKPAPSDIAMSRDAALELLQLRSTNPLLTLGSAELIKERVTFPNAGADQTAGLIVMHIADPAGAADVDPAKDGLLVAINASPEAITEAIDGQAGIEYVLDPVLTDGVRDDPVVATTTWETSSGTLTIPARSVVVLNDTAEPMVEYVTPVAPTFHDVNGWKHDRVVIPAVEGVEYLVDGQVVAAGSHPVAKGAKVTVDARPLEGYAFADGAEASWTYAFGNTAAWKKVPR